MKVKEELLNFIKESKDHIFDNYYLVCDNYQLLEEFVMSQTDTIFNLEIITYSQLIKSREIITNNQLTLKIYDYLTNHQTVFSQANPLSVSIQLGPLLREIDRYQGKPIKNNLKVEAIFQLLHHLNLENKTLTGERSFLNNLPQNNHYLFYTSQSSPLYHQLIAALTKNNQVIELKLPSSTIKAPIKINSYPTPHDEITKITLEINRLITKEKAKYQDIAIYYPDNNYRQRLQQALNKFSLSYTEIKDNYDPILYSFAKLLSFLTDRDDTDLIEVLLINRIKNQPDANYLKTYYLEKEQLDPQTEKIKELITSFAFADQDLISVYQETILKLINDIYPDDIFNQLKSKIENLDYLDINMAFDDYCQFLKNNLFLSQDIKKPLNDSIYLLSYQETAAYLLDIKYLFIPAANEDILPPAYSDNNLLLDWERNLVGLETINQKTTKFLTDLQLLLSGNYQTIYFSYTNYDNNDQELQEATFLKEIEEKYPFDNTAPENYLHHQNLSDYSLDFKLDLTNHPNPLIKEYTLRKNQPASLPTNSFSHNLSVSKFERYNACPYAYFLQYGLKLKPFKNPTFLPNDLGNIAHSVFEHNLFKFDGQEIENTKIYQALDTYVKTNYASKLTNPINNYLISVLLKDITLACQVLSRQNGGNFKPAKAEFKINKQYPNYRLVGLIDRYDLADKLVKIIDYKNSKKDLNLAYVKQGYDMQLLIYLNTLLQITDYQPAAILYFNYGHKVIEDSLNLGENIKDSFKMTGLVFDSAANYLDPIEPEEASAIYPFSYKKDGSFTSNSKVISLDDYQNLISTLNDLLDNLITRMDQGDIAISPSKFEDNSHDACQFCKYRSICQFDVFYNKYRIITKKGN